ncbi:SDR family oxidoreductase [Sporichthya brevicatena]|uniref:SDR family oxidoreductase n=1 Tax=Sporichthya brevicatena TaxID=171442 RepID=UPI0031D59920
MLITGAAQGIGQAIAERFARDGANVIAGDLGPPTETARLVEAHGVRCVAATVDVRRQSSLDAVVAEALARFGRIDTVVANAGIIAAAPLWEMTDETFTSILDVNVAGSWRTLKAATPSLIERGSGSVIVIGSIQSRVARKRLAAYTTSKHALLGLVKAAALELADHNVRVNAVLPGVIATPMVANSTSGHATDEGFRRMAALRNRSALDPGVIGAAISWLASDDAAEITGVELPVDAGSLILPGVNEFPVVE